MEKIIDPNGVMNIKQGGFYYNVSGNDALILHKYLGYKLYGVNTYRTGFPVSGQETVVEKLNDLYMNYDLIDQQGNIIISKRYEKNFYEIIDESEYTLPIPKAKSIIVKNDNSEESNRKMIFLNVLMGLCKELNIITGEVVTGLDADIKGILSDLMNYIKNK